MSYLKDSAGKQLYFSESDSVMDLVNGKIEDEGKQIKFAVGNGNNRDV